MNALVDLSEYKDTGIKRSDHYLGAVTRGVINSIAPEIVEAVKQAFDNAPRGDWFYPITCDKLKFFVQYNGEMGYTLMLPEEY